MKKLYRTALFAGVLAFGISACGDDVQIVDSETPTSPLSATLTPQSQNATVGETVTFAVGVSGGDSAQDPTWTCASSNNDVATVSGSSAGCDVTAVASGNASITATVTRGNQSTNAGASITVAAVADSPATVSIQSINAGGTPADIDSIHGQINVVLNVQENDETVNQVDVLVDGEVAASQVFTAAMLAEMAEEAGADLEALGTITLSLNTARYDVDHEAGTATVDFENGPRTISAQVHVDERETPRTATNTIQTVFQNEDLVLIELESGGTGMDAQGLRWRGQGLTATFIHVPFSGVEASSFASSFMDEDKTGQTVTWSTSDLAGEVTTADGDTLTVSAIVDGEPGPTNSRIVRYDGIAPEVGMDADVDSPVDFRLRAQAEDGTRRCCSNNWVNPDYSFSAGAPSTSDEGVGVTTTTYHVGSGTANITTAAAVAALPEADSPAAAELEASNVNTEYSVWALVTDAVGNRAFRQLQSDGGMNPNQTFGVDVNAPTDQALASAVPNRQINPGTAITIELTASDDVSGFGQFPVAVRYQRHSGEGYACPTGSGTTAATCARVQQAFSFDAAFPSDEGYYRYQGEVHDQAGNPSGTTTERIFLNDETSPDVDNVSGTAGSFTAGQDATFSVNATDNVDLRSAQFSFVYGEALDEIAVPFGPAESLGTPWEFDDLTTEATASSTVPFIVGVEHTTGGAPTGTTLEVEWARFVVSDVANNASTQQNNFVAGSFPDPVSFDDAFDGGATFELDAEAGHICINAENDCDEEETLTLTATATGPTGSFQNPFTYVFFVFEDPSNVLHYIAADATASVTDSGAPMGRVWTWEITLDGSTLDGYTFEQNDFVSIQAIGVDMNTGTALISGADDGSVQIEVNN